MEINKFQRNGDIVYYLKTDYRDFPSDSNIPLIRDGETEIYTWTGVVDNKLKFRKASNSSGPESLTLTRAEFEEAWTGDVGKKPPFNPDNAEHIEKISLV